MHQPFSFRRFRRLFVRHTVEHLPGYLMATAVLAGAMFLIMGFMAYILKGPWMLNWQGSFFRTFLLAAGGIFTSNILADFGDKRKATTALTLPASHLEKYLVAWFYSLPIFLLVYISVFYVVNLAVAYSNNGQGPPPQVLNVFSPHEKIYGIFWVFTMVHGVALWGAIFFEQMHYIKTAFAFFLLLGVIATINFLALKGLLGSGVRFVAPFASAVLADGKQVYNINLPDWHMAWLDLLPVGIAGLLWVAAYFRVTEKQI